MSLTREKIIKEVNRIFGSKSEQNFSGYVLLSVLAVGPNADKIAKFMSFNRNKVRKLIKRARKQRIILNKKTGFLNVEWFKQEGGGVAFVCDCMALDGLVKRVMK